MARENAALDDKENLNDGFAFFDYDQLEENLQGQLEENFKDLNFLQAEQEAIGNPDNLGEVIGNVVWEQFLNQLAVTAGEDFIDENRGLFLDIRDEAHIQTTENFADGKIATHNTEIDYQQRYNDWQSNFIKDENRNIVTHTSRCGKEKSTLVKNARVPFDKDRPSGSTVKHTDMDHTVPASEIIRDPAANAHMTKEAQIAFANSDANLNELDSSLNRSKGELSMTDWLDNPNSNGQKPKDIFDISDDDDKKLRQKDAEARKEYEKRKKEGAIESIKAGKKSQRDEAFRIGGKALRAVLMGLLADLVREMIGKLVKWFKTAKKSLDTLMNSLKEAIHSFVSKMKTHLINAGDSFLSTVATAIWGPIVGTIKKFWIMLKQGWKSLNNAIAFLKNPANKHMPFGKKVLEVGKIVIAGLTGAGAMVLGEVIEKGLLAIPVFAFEIPLLGSLANILGIFLGAAVAGIIGAIIINMIDKLIAKHQENDNLNSQIDKKNEILAVQDSLLGVKSQKLISTHQEVCKRITECHKEAGVQLAVILESVLDQSVSNTQDLNNEQLDRMLQDI